jgi:G protein beta subunit-like protein
VCFDLENGTISEEYRLKSHSDIQVRTIISPDGRFFATCSANSNAKVWDLATGGIAQSLTLDVERTWVMDIAFSDDSSKLCMGTSDGDCFLYDWDGGKMERAFTKASKAITCLAVLV